MRLSLWLSVDLYLTKQLHVTWNTGFFAFLYVDIHTTREPRLGKGSILFRKTNNNSNNKETLSSGIVLRIGLEFSRSRDSDSPTNLSMAKPVADRNAACILIITISLKGAGCYQPSSLFAPLHCFLWFSIQAPVYWVQLWCLYYF